MNDAEPIDDDARHCVVCRPPEDIVALADGRVENLPFCDSHEPNDFRALVDGLTGK